MFYTYFFLQKSIEDRSVKRCPDRSLKRSSGINPDGNLNGRSRGLNENMDTGLGKGLKRSLSIIKTEKTELITGLKTEKKEFKRDSGKVKS